MIRNFDKGRYRPFILRRDSLCQLWWMGKVWVGICGDMDN